MKMLDPSPEALGTAASSTRSCPNRSLAGAMMGDTGIARGDFTELMADRSLSELRELSIAGLSGAR
jgi:hypothetical protein